MKTNIMKYTKLPLIALLLSFTVHSFAQISVGIKTSQVKAWEEYGDVGLPDDARIHIHSVKVAATVYATVTNYLEIGIEPGYVQRGAACEPGFIIFNEDTKLMLNYFELPLLAKFNLKTKNQKGELFCKIGGSASYAMSAYREIMENESRPFSRTKLTFDEFGSMERWDYGVFGGLGLAYKLGPGKLSLEANYYHGLPDVDPFNRSENRSLEFGLGYSFSL